MSKIRQLLFNWVMLLTVLSGSRQSLAHPMPNSVVLLDIQSGGVSAELQLPLTELQLAFGHGVNRQTETLIERLGPQLKEYLIAHVRPLTQDSLPWSVEVLDLQVQPAEQSASGPYQELTAHLWLQPPTGANSRDFIFHYDVIVHQLVTHSALVSIRQDWEAGILSEQPVEVGMISLDVVNNVIPPLYVNLEDGNWFKGFKNMVKLGMHHIAEGTDHLLFLLILLLSAPLLPERKKWGSYGGTRYSVINLLRVITAFTIGHSVTLLAGALGWFRLPSQPVEVLIAFSILISAIHALRPIFPKREAYIAATFGLIHGLAFAGILTNLNLNTTQMALSIFGFNIGIELMQLFVMLLIIPWLIMLSCSPIYKWIRISGALFGGIAAVAWMVERIVDKTNPITTLVEQLVQYAPWIVFLLALSAIVILLKERFKVKSQI